MQKENTLLSPKTSIRKRSLKSYVHHYWLISRWLSLDVALGAVICSGMACKLMAVLPLPFPALAILGGTVWAIYTADHLWDVRNSNGDLVSPRRQFHWHYRKELRLIAGLLIGLLVLSAWMYLPLLIIRFGISLGGLVGLYLWMVTKFGVEGSKKLFHKELIIALLYTSGVWGVGFLYSQAIQGVHICLCVLFCLIALQNLLLFSLFEREEDFLQAQRSMVQTYGIKKIKAVIAGSFALFIIVAVYTWLMCHTIIEKQVLITQLVMSLVLFILFAFPGFFCKHRRYRWVGDGIFLLPVWLWFV